MIPIPIPRNPAMPNSTVSLVKCRDYDPDRTRAAVRDALAKLPDAAGLALENQRVLLKPNLLSSHDGPESAINTHPVFIQAVTEFFCERGCTVFIGDSCGSLSSGSTAKAMAVTGLHAIAKATGAELVDFDKAPSKEVAISGGKVLQRVRIPKIVHEVDLFVTLPKMKTHGLTQLTGAVKNQLGLVPGRGKKDVHLQAPKPAAMAQAMVDILSVARPHLAIVDGIVAMEGNGPAAGKPRDAGVVIAGWDPVSVDAVMAEVMGFAPGDVPMTRYAHERGLGVGQLDEIEILGPPLAEVKPLNFKKPPSSVSGIIFALVPNAVVRLLLDQLGSSYPVILDDRCIVCGECITNCPAQALKQVEGKVRVTRSHCIGCYCCSEVCKERAVEMTHPFLGRVVRKLAHLILRRKSG